jgi:hypothetical protein
MVLYGPLTDIDTINIDYNLVGFVPPSNYVPNRLVAEANANLVDFYYLLHQAVKLLKPEIMCVPAYPDYLLAGTVAGQKILEVDDPTSYMADTITFRIVRRLPGILSQDAPDSKSAVRERTWHIREIKHPPPGFHDKRMIVKGKYFDNWIKFEFWSASNYRVEQMMLWFEEMMGLCRGTYFKRFGVAEVLFDKSEITAQYENTMIKKINYRCADYYVRTEQLLLDTEGILKRINVKFVENFNT